MANVPASPSKDTSMCETSSSPLGCREVPIEEARRVHVPVPMLLFPHFLTMEVKDTYLIFLNLAYNASDAVPNSELDTTLTGLW